MNIKKVIYKRLITKSKNLYTLGGDDLIKLQIDYIPIVKRALHRSYLKVLKEVAINKEIFINDLLNSLDYEKIQKFSFKSISSVLKKAFNIGDKKAKKQYEAEVGVGFILPSEEVIKYAEENAGRLITQIDDTTRKRVNKVIAKAIKKGMGYNELAEILRQDYSFSDYRAVLIASHELGEAYLAGAEAQFNNHLKQLGLPYGYKKWQTQEDDVVSDGCMENSMASWIASNKDFPSGHSRPTRFPGCRCNLRTRLKLERDNSHSKSPFNYDYKPKAGFTPAQNLYEAEEFAKKFVNNVNYEQFTLTESNIINEELQNFKNTINLNVEINSFDNKHLEDGILGMAYKNNVSLVIENIRVAEKYKKIHLVNIELDKKAILKKLIKQGDIKAIERLERESLYDVVGDIEGTDFLKATIYHELGHVLHREVNNENTTKILTKFKKELEYKNILTRYAKTSNKELFAESFVAYMLGKKEMLSKDMINLFDNFTKNARKFKN